MTLHILSSSSSGNCYLLRTSSGRVLILEAGVKWARIQRALGHKLGDVVGCLVSHRHGDHAQAVPDLLKAGIRVFTLADVVEQQSPLHAHFATTLPTGRWLGVGDGFKVYALPAIHDVPCLSFVIDHQEMGRTLFITDSVSFEYRLPRLTHLMIEANYADDILTERIDRGHVPPSMRPRLLGSHMELATTLCLLQAQDLSTVSDILLLHLSSQNADPVRFRLAVEQATGLPTRVATGGMILDFNRSPF